MKAKRDVYQEVTDKIVAALEAGTVPWVKPWKNTNSPRPAMGMPYNAHTNRAYSGVNIMLLWSQSTEYGCDGWLTYNQAKNRGGNVVKGERGTMITLFKPCNGKDKATGEENTFFLLRAYTVFNVEQCEWPEGSNKPSGTPPASPISDSNMLDVAAALKVNLKVQGNKACYIPSADQVHIPPQDSFTSADQFDSTLAHEVTHWTSHRSRCDRQLGKRFGDDAYAFEELIAELGSAFLCAQLGIALEGLQHDSYITSWVRRMKDDKKAIFAASSQARQSNEWIHETVLSNITNEAAQEQVA